MGGRPERLIVTCEHGGHRVPGEVSAAFRGAERTLRSHRGWDRGALPAARRLARVLGATLHSTTVSRLVVEVNRSLHHPRLFSEFTRDLSEATRERLLARHYRPYRDEVERSIERHVRAGDRVLHLSVHSFTPRMNGVVRRADLGLLYDPARTGERRLCLEWRRRLGVAAPDLHVRRNYPYRGNADGFTTWLRHRFAPSAYRGIELEFNRALLDDPRRASPALAAVERLFG